VAKTLIFEEVEKTARLYVQGLSNADMASELLITPYAVTRRVRSGAVWTRIVELGGVPKKKLGRPKGKHRSKKTRKYRRKLSDNQLPTPRKTWPYDPTKLIPSYVREEREERHKRRGPQTPPNYRTLKNRALQAASGPQKGPRPRKTPPRPMLTLKVRALASAQVD